MLPYFPQKKFPTNISNGCNVAQCLNLNEEPLWSVLTAASPKMMSVTTARPLN
ncbi:hypothetical protein GBAR_LOCUS9557 [Geodia barretti]|uniref:Uncharacterized protein n=1 Tax=Geodia barretti TaxID=519541 RepID=A0AA35RPP1_GEOBA|nr:hypothetical protein GBAR_LOCUS9557 [Geodia barretti]